MAHERTIATFFVAENQIRMEVLKIDNTEAKVKGKMVPIWKKYMLTVDEAVLYFGIGEKKIRMLISENVDSDYCFTVQVGNKSLINRHKFEEFTYL